MRTLIVGGLVLEPQTAAHAPRMLALLSDPELSRYLDDGPPPDEAWLAARFARLESRRSADGLEHWLNWVIRVPAHGLVGFVQATVHADGAADVAYELGTAFQGRGFATRALAAMLREVAQQYGVRRAFATIDRRNLASVRVVTRLGFAQLAPGAHHPHDPVARGDDLFLRDPAFDSRLMVGD